ncbi:VRR-NUC domain-containing protein [Falsigemmobacter intermedius]
MTARQSPERKVHLAVLGFLRSVLFGNPVIHHSPNEFGMAGAAVARQIAKHKHLGMAVGFPDLVAFTFHGPLFFEVKAKGNYATPEQKFVHAELSRLGYRVAVVKSIEDVRAKLAEWGIPTKETEQQGEVFP